MQIKLENQGNNIINFYPAQALMTEDSIYVFDKKTTVNNELCRNILALDGVERLLLTPEMISVKYNGEDIDTLQMLIMAEIDDYFAAPYSLSSTSKPDAKECAEALADALIRPILGKDGGGICIHDINNGVMDISFTGHCSGCPYAQNTLQNVVSKTFLCYLPQIREIKLRETA